MRAARSLDMEALKGRLKCVFAVVLTTAYVAVSFAAALTVPVSAAAAPGKMYLSPATISVGQGADVAVQVRLDTGGDVMNAIQANFSYPANLLTYTSISGEGSAFGISAPSGGTGGTVNIARADFNGAKGDVLVATVNFHAIGLGSGKLDFTTGSEAYRSGDSTNAVGSNVGATLSVGATGSSVSPPPSASPSPSSTPSTTDGDTSSNLPSSADLSALPDDGVSNTVEVDNTAAPKSSSVIWPVFIVALLVAGGVGAAIYLQRRQQSGYGDYENYGYDLPVEGQSYADGNNGVPLAGPTSQPATPGLPPVNTAFGQPAAPQVNLTDPGAMTGMAPPAAAPTSWQPTLSSIPAPSVMPHVPGAQPAVFVPTTSITPAASANAAAPFGPPATQAPSQLINPDNNQLPR